MTAGQLTLERSEPASAAAFEVEVIRDEAGFDALREEWGRVTGLLELESPMLSWEWARLWWDYFRGRNELHILVFRQSGRAVGIAQLQERRLGLGRASFRTVKPIGWEDGGNQGLTEHLELLFPAAHRAALLSELGRRLGDGGPGTLWLPGIGVDEKLPSSLERQVIHGQVPVPFHHRQLPDDWSAFIQSLGKSMRDNAKYYPRLLERRGFQAEFEVAATPAEVRAALPVLIELHRTRAQAEHVSSVRHWDHFYEPRRREFMLEIAPRLAAEGKLKVGLLRIGGEAVAAQIWFEQRRTLWLYYSGFLPEWSKYSVALVATLEVLKQGLARGFDRVEFCRGGGQLKERWDTEARVQRNLVCASSPRLGRAFLKAKRETDGLRSVLRWSGR